MATQADDTKLQRNNWADEKSDGEEEEDDREIGGSSVAQIGQPTAAQTEKANEEAFTEAQPARTFIPNKPRQKRERNIYGDFVVTKINIKDKVIEIPSDDDEEEEEESSEEEEATPVVEEEEVKKGKCDFRQIEWLLTRNRIPRTYLNHYFVCIQPLSSSSVRKSRSVLKTKSLLNS